MIKIAREFRSGILIYRLTESSPAAVFFALSMADRSQTKGHVQSQTCTIGYMSLFQVIYVSAASPLFKPTDLPAILIQAREHNQREGISGLLLFHEGTFVQVLEGPKPSIELLLKKISSDPRHQNIKLLFQQDIEEKEFDDWAMGFVDVKMLSSKIGGFVDVSTELSALISKETTAHKALRRFMEGNFKKYVES